MYYYFLTDKGLTTMKNHKYVGGSYTKVDNLMNNFWNKVADLVPSNFAPNLITLTGLYFLVTSTLLYLLNDYHLKMKASFIVYLYSFFCLFIYQTLDAVDGKQARKINNSTPLGQLFDHGCDSMATVLICYSFIGMAGIGGDMLTVFLLFVSSTTVFYMANWTEYHTKVLVTNSGWFGVTESEILLQLFFLVTTFTGNSIWHFQLNFGLFKICFYQLTVYLTFTFSVYNFVWLSFGSFKVCKSKIKYLLMLVPLFFYIAGNCFLFFSKNYFANLSTIYFLCSLNFVLMTLKIILCSITQVL